MTKNGGINEIGVMRVGRLYVRDLRDGDELNSLFDSVPTLQSAELQIR